jgi:hypothetical protein
VIICFVKKIFQQPRRQKSRADINEQAAGRVIPRIAEGFVQLTICKIRQGPIARQRIHNSSKSNVYFYLKCCPGLLFIGLSWPSVQVEFDMPGVQCTVQWNSSISETVRNKTRAHILFFSMNDRCYDLPEYWLFLLGHPVYKLSWKACNIEKLLDYVFIIWWEPELPFCEHTWFSFGKVSCSSYGVFSEKIYIKISTHTGNTIFNEDTEKYGHGPREA